MSKLCFRDQALIYLDARNKTGCAECLKEIILISADQEELETLMRSYELLGEVYIYYKDYDKAAEVFLQMVSNASF